MFVTKKIAVSKTTDARKEKIEGAQAWELFQTASEVLIAKGKKILHLNPGETDKETVLTSALGRSGTLRAPTLKIGNKFLVGFNEELYSAIPEMKNL